MRRKFNTKGELNPEFHFMVPRVAFKEMQKQTIKTGTCMFLYAHRQSGKTTFMNMLSSELNEEGEVASIWITFQQGISFKNVDLFWKSFITQLETVASVKFPVFDDPATSFARGFETKENKFTKPTVLWIDECDIILYAPEEIRLSFLSTIRGIRQSKNRFYLRSVIGIGVFQILDLSTASTSMMASPFNISDGIEVPHFTYEETKRLFTDFEQDSSVKLEDGIVDDIFALTNGHPGLVSLCGEQIQEYLCREQDSVSFESWIEYSKMSLIHKLQTSSTYHSMMLFLKARQSELSTLCYNWLLDKFTVAPSALVRGEDERVVSTLITNGVLVDFCEEGNRFVKFTAPLLYSLWLFDTGFSYENVPRIHPLLEDASLDCLELLAQAMKLMSLRTLKDPRVQKVNNTPTEYVFHFQLYSAISFLLSGGCTDYRVIPEAKDRDEMGRKRLDILIANTNRYALELGAGPSEAQLKEHFNRAVLYAKALRCKYTYLIHFTIEQPTKPYFDSRSDPKVEIIHIYLNLPNRKFTIYQREHTDISDTFAELSLKDSVKNTIRSTIYSLPRSTPKKITTLFSKFSSAEPNGNVLIPGNEMDTSTQPVQKVSNNIITLCKVGKKHGYKISIPNNMINLLAIAKTKLNIDVVEIWDEEQDCIDFEIVMPGKTYFGATKEDIEKRD